MIGSWYVSFHVSYRQNYETKIGEIRYLGYVLDVGRIWCRFEFGVFLIRILKELFS